MPSLYGDQAGLSNLTGSSTTENGAADCGSCDAPKPLADDYAFGLHRKRPPCFEICTNPGHGKWGMNVIVCGEDAGTQNTSDVAASFDRLRQRSFAPCIPLWRARIPWPLPGAVASRRRRAHAIRRECSQEAALEPPSVRATDTSTGPCRWRTSFVLGFGSKSRSHIRHV